MEYKGDNQSDRHLNYLTWQNDCRGPEKVL